MVVTNATWSNTVCPVGRNSSETKSGTCDGFLIFGVTPSGTPLEQISCQLALITQP